jgi:Tfp pilus assembly protein PilN
MIRINLLPGAAKSARGFGGGAALSSVSGAVTGIASGVRDPFLAGAVGAILVSAAAIGTLYTGQSRRAADLAEREQRAVQDSTRYAAVIAERKHTVAQRDSVVRQIEIIQAIDNNRYVWPHVLDEVSRSLPSYTWLTSMQQTSAAPVPPGADVAPAESGAKPEAKDTVHVDPATKFRVVGHTVDIQALTLFMKQLEASPFIQNVQLAKSEVVLADGKDITEFALDAEYQLPERALLRTSPVTISVR